MMWFLGNTECGAALQLYITTKDEQYARRFNELIWPQLDSALDWNIATAAKAVRYMPKEYKSKLEKYVLKYRGEIDKLGQQNPYGVLIGTRGWAGDAELINWSITNYYLNKSYPDVIGREYVYKALNYIFGCHPYSNISFVAGVGNTFEKRELWEQQGGFLIYRRRGRPRSASVEAGLSWRTRTIGRSCGVRMKWSSIFVQTTFFSRMRPMNL